MKNDSEKEKRSLYWLLGGIGVAIIAGTLIAVFVNRNEKNSSSSEPRVASTADTSSNSAAGSATSEKKKVDDVDEDDVTATCNKATTFSRALFDYANSLRDKHDTLESVSSKKIADDLVPDPNQKAVENTNGKYNIIWEDLTPMVEPGEGAAGDKTVSVHVAFRMNSDKAKTLNEGVLLYKFHNGKIQTYKYYPAAQSQAATETNSSSDAE